MVFKTQIVKIGSDHGVRIPKIWLDEIDLGEEVELVLQPDQIVIRRAGQVREGWARAFRAMAKQDDDRLLDQASIAVSAPDEDDWTW